MGSLAGNVIFNISNLQRLFEGILITAQIAFVSIILGSLFSDKIETENNSRSHYTYRIQHIFRFIP